MIQNILPHEFHNEYENVHAKPTDTVFVFRGRNVLATEGAEVSGGEITFPSAKDFGEAAGVLRYLFRIDEQRFFLLLPEDNAKAGEPALPGFSYIPLMTIRNDCGNVDAFASLTAYHLSVWYSRNRFCGKCGSGRLEHGERERVLKCPDCGNMIFPAISPAVIVGVTWGEKLLMTKYAGREYGGWALIAGFCEIGEEVEDTVHREVLEEAGVRVKNLRYVASQPWGLDSNLLMGYFCDVDGDASIHMDEAELSRAVWVDRADVPDMSDNVSLTGHMIELFRKGQA